MGFNKKVLSKAVSELGKAKAPGKPRDITVDPKGYWNPANQGQPVRIPGNGDPKGVDITMGSDPKTGQSVPYPVWAQPNIGPGAMMQPNQDYNFPGASYVDETPMAKKGGTLQSKKYSKSMSATNKLFTKNKLFQNKKSKIFDPNAEFKKGGSKLGTINLNPNPLSHYELNYGFNLPTEENGGEADYEDQDLTDEEIQALRDAGYVVEELPEAQVGGPQNTSGPRYGTLAGDENLNLPEGYTQEQREAARRKRDSDASQQKNLKYQEQEKAKINSRLKPAGLTENFRQGGILDSYQKKGQVQPKAAVKGKPYNFYTSPLGKVVGQGLAIQQKQALDRYNNTQNSKSNVGWSNEKSVTPSKKKPVQPTVQQKAAQKLFDEKFKVTGKDAYTKVKDKIAASQKDYIASGKKNGYAITQKDLDDIENMHWKSAGVGQIGEPDMMQATPTQSNTNRAWEYVTNPFTAAEYAISGGGAENMPHNINEMRMAGIDPGVVQGRNLVGNTLNSTLNLFDAGDKTARNVYRGNYGAAALEAMRFIPGGGLLDDAIRLGVKPGAKYLGKSLNKLSKYVPENVPVNTGSTLNAGISPQLIKNTIGTGNKVGANLLNKAYISPFFSKAFNRYSPLNLIKGYGSKLEGAVRPLGNVLGKSIKNNKLTGSKPLFGKAKELSTQVGKTDASNIYAAKFDDAVEGSNIRLGEANPQGRFSRKSNATFPIQTKAGVNRYDLPISDPGVALHRRLPFSNKYVPIDKQKLMNNKFQWSTTGAGLQNVAEKYGKGVVGSTLGYGAYNAYNYDKNKPETFATPEEIELANKYNSGQFAESDVPSRAEMFKRGAKEAYESPLDYAKNPYFVNDIYQGLNPTQEEKNGGSIESWEDDLDEEEIRLLKEAGFIVEELK